jgi:toxin ParE1/3/4
MHMRFRITRLADADLVEIAEYTARQWGDAPALKYCSALQTAFNRIGDGPMTPRSRARDDLLPECRVIAVEQHFVVYRRRDDATEILHVLHQRMNLPLHRLA